MHMESFSAMQNIVMHIASKQCGARSVKQRGTQ